MKSRLFEQIYYILFFILASKPCFSIIKYVIIQIESGSVTQIHMRYKKKLEKTQYTSNKFYKNKK